MQPPVASRQAQAGFRSGMRGVVVNCSRTNVGQSGERQISVSECNPWLAVVWMNLQS